MSSYTLNPITGFKALYEAWEKINPATLSGAIDVIVVEQPNGELACSPFHVRFGKLSLLNPREKLVEIEVNGEKVNFPMKVGEAGEAFFVFETENDVPSAFQTSPIVGAQDDGEQEEPPAFNLEESFDEKLANDEKVLLSDEKSEHKVLGSPKRERSSSKSVKTLENEYLKAAAGQQDAFAPERPTTFKLQDSFSEDFTPSESPFNTADYDPIGEAQGSHEIIINDDEPVRPLEMGQVEKSGERDKIYSTKSLKPTVTGGDMNNIAEEVTRKGARENITNSSHNPIEKGQIILDIDGYKGEEITEEELQRIARRGTVSNVNIDMLDADSQDHMSSSVWNHGKTALPLPRLLRKEASSPALLQNVRQGRERSMSVPHDRLGNPQGAKSETTIDMDAELDEQEIERVVNRGPLSDTEDYMTTAKRDSLENNLRDGWSWKWGGLPVKNDTNEVLEDDPDDRHMLIPNSAIELTGQQDRIEWSLCGNNEYTKDEANNDDVFRKHQISYDKFMENPGLLQDKSLVIKFKNRYYHWPVAAPLFASLLVYQRPLPELTMQRLSAAHNPTSRFIIGAYASDAAAAKSGDDKRSSYWVTRWWRGSASNQTTLSKESSKKSNEDIGEHDNNLITAGTKSLSTDPIVTSNDEKEQLETSPLPFLKPEKKHYAKTLRLTSDQLKLLNLKKGANLISFTVTSSLQGKATCTAKIFRWEHDNQVVISDIDGTITKSDALGHVFAMMGRDWTHSGVAQLYTGIYNNGYKVLYLTSRAIGQADYTREYLKKVDQNRFQLPDGPVIMSPDRLFVAFHREVIMRKPEEFKKSALADIEKLFGDRIPFYAGFGNRLTDAISYRHVHVPPSRIFTIEYNGDVRLELLSASGYKTGYVFLNDLVDEIFPPVNKKLEPEFNDYNFWKNPLPKIELPELPTPSSSASSPRLTAIDGNSTQKGLVRSMTSLFTSSSSDLRRSPSPIYMDKTEESPRESSHSLIGSIPFLSSSPSSISSLTFRSDIIAEKELTDDDPLKLVNSETGSNIHRLEETILGDDEGEYEGEDEDGMGYEEDEDEDEDREEDALGLDDLHEIEAVTQTPYD